uniref:Uncharacterized protein n=1 Tax=Medicago truncatula TaxID=3880 RepID=A4Q376_MEDTR|nr:hypothetical protein MtrDRAFT_AC153123g47v2 [Medicago truncatula]
MDLLLDQLACNIHDSYVVKENVSEDHRIFMPVFIYSPISIFHLVSITCHSLIDLLTYQLLFSN